MQGLSFAQLSGMMLTLAFITAVGIWSGKKVKSTSDFSSGGGKASSVMVAGSTMGTIVGGASTIGTAQFAFSNGFSAVWFTLGGGISCLVLALLAGRLRGAGCSTLQQIIAKEYGPATGMVASLFVSMGLFVSIVAQVLSATALLGTLLRLPVLACAVISVLLMICYVLFGGVWGTSMVGTVKTVLLYVGAVACGLLVLTRGGGLSALYRAVPAEQYFNLLARGIGVESGEALSMVFGVVSTQAYAQYVFSAKDTATARKGLLLSAVLIPPIGVCGVLCGIHMQAYTPSIASAQAFPQFVLQMFPGFFAGIMLAALLAAILGSSAGLALGVASIVNQDIYRRLRPQADDKTSLLVTRLVIVATLGLTLLFTAERLQAVILSWSFLSMTFRAALTFLPLMGALFLPGKIDRRFALAAMAAGPVMVLAGELVIHPPFDPLFLGMAAALLMMALGWLAHALRARR